MADLDDQHFKEQLSLWEKASSSGDPKFTIAYLDAFPTGFYSQLAEVRLDQLLAAQGEKKLVIPSSANNPFTKGMVSGVMEYSVGDAYSYSRKDSLTGIEENAFTQKVTKVTDSEIAFNNGRQVIDIMGNDLISPNERFLSPAQFYPAEYVLGNKWITRYAWKKGDGVDSSVEMEFKIIGREKMETPAGRFNAFVIDGMGYVLGGSKFEMRYWIDPETCNRPIWFDRVSKNRKQGKVRMSTRDELVSFQQKKSAKKS